MLTLHNQKDKQRFEIINLGLILYICTSFKKIETVKNGT
jgi:hypothetical protein